MQTLLLLSKDSNLRYVEAEEYRNEMVQDPLLSTWRAAQKFFRKCLEKDFSVSGDNVPILWTL